ILSESEEPALSNVEGIRPRTQRDAGGDARGVVMTYRAARARGFQPRADQRGKPRKRDAREYIPSLQDIRLVAAWGTGFSIPCPGRARYRSTTALASRQAFLVLTRCSPSRSYAPGVGRGLGASVAGQRAA